MLGDNKIKRLYRKHEVHVTSYKIWECEAKSCNHFLQSDNPPFSSHLICLFLCKSKHVGANQTPGGHQGYIRPLLRPRNNDPRSPPQVPDRSSGRKSGHQGRCGSHCQCPHCSPASRHLSIQGSGSPSLFLVPLRRRQSSPLAFRLGNFTFCFIYGGVFSLRCQIPAHEFLTTLIKMCRFHHSIAILEWSVASILGAAWHECSVAALFHLYKSQFLSNRESTQQWLQRCPHYRSTAERCKSNWIGSVAKFHRRWCGCSSWHVWN